LNSTLFEAAGIPLRAYSVFLALSFVVGTLLALRRAAARAIPRTVILDVAILSFVASIAGARAFYLLLHPHAVRTWAEALALGSGGLAMYGGVVAAMAACWLYLRFRAVPFLRVADAVAPSLALGLALTRVGCFLNGCCFGLPLEGAFGVSFPPGSAAHAVFGSRTLHAAQLYSAATGVLIVLLLLALERYLPRAGQLFGLYLMADAAGRIGLDFYRYYEPAALVGAFTVHQLVCAGLFALGAVLLLRRRGDAARPAAFATR
jgi:phosphatidylglycerol:prolipoprotein diacylglycerol transferase